MRTDTDNFVRPVIATVDHPRSPNPVHSARSATCGECGQRFSPNIQTTRISGGGEQWHFICPHCGHHYNVCRITRQGIELRRQLDSIKSQIRLAPHDGSLVEKRDALLVALEAEITDLTKAEVNQ